MDIEGTAPSSDVGQYIRFSVWGWRPMADFMRAAAPALAGMVQYLDTNDGDGLDAEHSRQLADRFDELLMNGEADLYVIERDAAIAVLPDERCPHCTETPGFRTWPGKDGRPDRTVPCNGCGSAGQRPGWIRPWVTAYGMDVSDVKRMSAFLRACGGFKIY